MAREIPSTASSRLAHIEDEIDSQNSVDLAATVDP